MSALTDTSTPVSKATEVLFLLERAKSRHPGGRRVRSSSSDLRRATGLMSSLLKGQGFDRWGHTGRRRPLSPEAKERLGLAVQRFVVHPLHYNCVPACCDASAIRTRQITVTCRALDYLAKKAPHRLVHLTSPQVQVWMAPSSTRIAYRAAAAFASSPEGTAHHWMVVAHALVHHPQWQVREFLLRAVARAPWPSPPKRLVEAVKRGVRSADPRLLREVWQRRALAELTGAAKNPEGL